MRRSGLALFCTLDCPWTQRVRIVAGEKGLPLELIEVPAGGRNEELAEMSPDASLPTLIDRDVLLFDSRVIADYLDERFPHPPLMPIDPVTRAQFRVALHRIERDWYTAAKAIAAEGDARQRSAARDRLRRLLLDSAELFRVKRFFLSDEFSLVDATIAPILWRLPQFEIDLAGADGQPIMKYANQVFARPAFQRSLQDGRLSR
jgi:RNA polymerase-associated protein